MKPHRSAKINLNNTALEDKLFAFVDTIERTTSKHCIVFITSLLAHMFHFRDGGHPGFSVEGRGIHRVFANKIHITMRKYEGVSPIV